MAQRSSRKRRKRRERTRSDTAVERRRGSDSAVQRRPESDAAVETRPGSDSAAETRPGSDSAAETRPAPGNPMARRYARAREKDAEARAALVPLAEGERPTAVTVAGVVALLLGLANLALYAANVEVQGDRPAVAGVVFYAGLMFVAAWGCFRSRYWAVLGMQMLLGLLLVVFSLLLIGASNLLAVVVSLAVIVSAGVLFWKLVKAMARIRMPERPGAT